LITAIDDYLLAVGARSRGTCNVKKARRKSLDGNLPAFVSARTSSYRLHAFDYLSGVMTEQKFGAQVLAETSGCVCPGQYLDGTVAI